MEQFEKLSGNVAKDLALDEPFVFGQKNRIRNCWHFSTDGSFVNSIFVDDEDFLSGMNRIYVVLNRYRVVILAFILMSNHVHFILHGKQEECKEFMNEYIRRTSMSVSLRHGEAKKLKGIPIGFHAIEDDNYLKTAICYVVRNAVAAGLPYTPWDYPWGSGALYFRKRDTWASPSWTIGCKVAPSMSNGSKCALFKTHEMLPDGLKMIDDLVFPGEYVDYKLVECIFKSEKAYVHFLCRSKEYHVEQEMGMTSRLRIPDQELRQFKSEICARLYGRVGTHYLDVNQRLRLARELRCRFCCSKKQIARVCGLVFDEVKDLI
jgi:hypothetical protein